MTIKKLLVVAGKRNNSHGKSKSQPKRCASSGGRTSVLCILMILFSTTSWKQSSKSSLVPADWSSKVGSFVIASGHLDKKLPDWRLAVDCSVFDFTCPTIRLGRDIYEEYPFPYGRSEPHEHLYQWENLDQVPSNWIRALTENYSSPQPIQYIYKQEAAPKAYKKCLLDAKTQPWKEQLVALLSKRGTRNGMRIQPDPDTNLLAFTISDYAYSKDMIHETFEMNDNILGFKDAFFMVALDPRTLELACRYEYPVIAWPSALNVAPSDNSTAGIEELKHSVANTKMEVSLALVQLKRDFFFYEMDLWFLKSPKPILKLFWDDILFSGHQNCPQSVNIGAYLVRANRNTQEYFETAIQLAKDSPNTRDQVLMAQLVHISKSKGNYQYGEKGWDPIPDYVPKLRPIQSGHFSPHEIIAHERPYANQMAIAVHPLRESPLKDPHGKKMLAKEMGAWYGFQGPNGEAGYYSRRGSSHRRYLWGMDGHILNGYSTMMNWEFNPTESGLYQSLDNLKWTVATLLAIAKHTSRIWILPPVMEERGIHFLWTLLDLQSVEDLGIEYRETTFANNPKAWFSSTEPFETVARTALGDFQKDGTMFAQYEKTNKKNTDNNNNNNKLTTTRTTTTRAWRFNTTLGLDKIDAIDAWWALHTSIPEVNEAELLLVNPHFMNQHYHRPLVSKMRTEYHNKMKPARESGKGRAEYEIVSIFWRLRWCIDKTTNHPDRIVGVYKANEDCYGKGI